MKKTILFFIFLSTALLANTIDAILSHMPAEHKTQRDELSAELLALGGSAIEEMCVRLSMPGSENAAARFAVSGLCDYVGRTETSQDRILVQSALLAVLAAAGQADVKTFLMEQLALIGDVNVIASLEPYLVNEELVDPAVRAMISINAPQAESVLLKNLPAAKGKQTVSILNALGEIGSPDAAQAVLPFAKSDNAELRDVALFALSKTASPDAGDALRQAIETSQGLERDKVYDYYCTFIEQQADSKAAVLYRQLLKDNPPVHVACRALSGLVARQGEQCLADLLDAAQKEDELCACALRLSAPFKTDAYTRAWIDFAENTTPFKHALVLSACAHRTDSNAQFFVACGLSSASPEVRLAAIPAYAQQHGADAYEELLAVLQRGQADEVEAAIDALLSYASDDHVLDRLEVDLQSMPPLAQAAVLRAFTARLAVDKKATIFAKAGDDNSELRLAALQGVEAMADSADVPRLLTLLHKAQNDSDWPLLQNALVRAANSAKRVNASPIFDAFKRMDEPRQEVLLHVLSQLDSRVALEKVIDMAVDPKETFRPVATKALASGPQPGVIPKLLDIAGETKNEEGRKLALQKATRLARDSWRLSIEERLSYCRILVDAVSTTDEKLRVIDIAARDQSLASLEFVEPYLESADLQRGAARTAVDIIVPDSDDRPGLADAKAVSILLKVLAIPTDTETRERAQSHLRTLGVLGVDPQTGEDLNQPPAGFVALFNGRDLSGWKGLAGEGGNPMAREKLSPEELKIEQAKADSIMRAHWSVENGLLIFDGHGSHLCTQKEYRNFELLVDWKIEPGGDSGLYLRGSPQVQIWDPAQFPEGSGGLYNNQIGPSKPLVTADNPVGQWNTFRIQMIDDRVTVFLNDKLVVDNVVLENYWDRQQPIFPTGQIELQSHGSKLYFRNIFLRDIFTAEDGWTSLFDGESLNGWQGDVDGYTVQNGAIVSKPGSGGNIYTDKQYRDFDFTFEFKLAPGANSGLGIRTPLKGDAAYVGMELQILDNNALQYADLLEYQYHGSVYGVVPAKRGFQKPIGEWNSQFVSVKGNHIKIELNGVTILDADIVKASQPHTVDQRKHPGLKNKKGYIGFLGHHAHVEFRNINIREK